MAGSGHHLPSHVLPGACYCIQVTLMAGGFSTDHRLMWCKLAVECDEIDADEIELCEIEEPTFKGKTNL